LTSRLNKVSIRKLTLFTFPESKTYKLEGLFVALSNQAMGILKILLYSSLRISYTNPSEILLYRAAEHVSQIKDAKAKIKKYKLYISA
jgi:hypothetical protein